MLRQLLKLLLLLLLVFVINLPSCWSLCDISASRRCAHVRRCKKLDPDNQFVEEIASRAAEQAGVVSPSVIEAYPEPEEEPPVPPGRGASRMTGPHVTLRMKNVLVFNVFKIFVKIFVQNEIHR